MRRRDVVVIGASAGGVEALMRLVDTLPADLDAAVCVVLHVPAHGMSRLPEVLNRSGPLRAHHAVDGEPLRSGQIYVAPPDHHMLIGRGAVHLSRGPRENRSRPAIDPLFRSAALAYGSRVVGVILSGTLDDGAAGLLTIKEAGGYAIVQDPNEAAFQTMPVNALESVPVDACLPVAEIGEALVRLSSRPVAGRRDEAMDDEIRQEVAVANFDLAEIQNPDRPGAPSVFACPECHGVLFEVREGELVRFRCRVGHAYSVDTLRGGQDDAIEEALWTALRALEEKAELTRRLRRWAQGRNLPHMAERYEREVAAALERVALLRDFLLTSQDEPVVKRSDAASA